MDEHEQVFHHDSTGEDDKDPKSPSKQAQEVLSAEITKLSIDDKSKAV